MTPRTHLTSAAGLRVPAVLLAAALLVAAGASDAAAQRADSATATLSGRVVSAMTGGPLENARVVLKNAGRGAVTDSTGHFAIRDAPAGRDTVQVSLIGFTQKQVPLTLKPGHTTDVTLLLSETVLKVEDISVEVESSGLPEKLTNAGFDRRMKVRHGHFITPEEIEERNPRQPSDLLRTVPGVSVGAYQFGEAPVRITRGPVGKQGCEPVYWVDGQVLQGYNLDRLNPDDILAMEIYRGPAETPQRFKFQTLGCGVIVVWTQQGGTR